MHLFTDNQVTHLYVASGLQNTEGSMVTGNVAFRKIGDSMYMLFKSKKGDIQRSDIIDIKNIMWAKATRASVMTRKARKTTITIGSGASATLVAGQTYIVNLRFDHYQGMSDEDITYKVGSYLATSNSDTTSTAAEAIASELAANLGMGWDSTNHQSTASNSTVNSLDNNLVTISVSSNVITITEKFQPWHLGTMQVVPVYFSASVAPIVSGGIETTSWATVANDLEDSGTTLVNSKDIADMEYFYMGERGDQYRLNGFPNYIPTDYLVEAGNKYGYDTFQIHYYYVGSNEQAQKSEKDLIIVAPFAQSSTNATKFGDIMEAIIGSTGSSGATFAYVSQITPEKKLA
jgi:hypothetical protein